MLMEFIESGYLKVKNPEDIIDEDFGDDVDPDPLIVDTNSNSTNST